MARKTILDNWLETTKAENNEENVLRSIVSTISNPYHSLYRTVYLKLPGKTISNKANNLFTMWNSTKVTKNKKEIFDKRCIIPIGSEFYVSFHKRNYDLYILDSITDDNSCRIRQKNSKHTQSYNLDDLNRYIHKETWLPNNPSIETLNNIKNFKFKSRSVTFDKFKLISTNNSINNFYHVTLPNNSYFTISQSPTGNCQLACIGYLETLMIHFTKNELIEQFKEIRKIGKKVLLVDIHTSKADELREMMPGNIISETPYISTNNSKMSIVLINIDKL